MKTILVELSEEEYDQVSKHAWLRGKSPAELLLTLFRGMNKEQAHISLPQPPPTEPTPTRPEGPAALRRVSTYPPVFQLDKDDEDLDSER